MAEKKEAMGKKAKSLKGLAKPKKPTKEQRLERQTLVLIFVLVMIIGAVFGVFFLSKVLKKPYFDYADFRVWRVQLEGTDRIYYSIPTSLTISGQQFQKNTVLRYDPRELDKLNFTFSVSDLFFRTRPSEMHVLWGPEEKGKIVESALELKKFLENLMMPMNGTTLNCENTSDQKRAIWLKISDEMSIKQNETYPYCVAIGADSYDNLIVASDKFVWEWLLRISR